MRIVVAHHFPVPTQPTEAWFLVENWAESLGYKIVERSIDGCRIKRGSSMTYYQMDTETVRTAATWGEITIREGEGLAALAVATEGGIGPIGSRDAEWREYLKAELALLGREVGDAEKGRLLTLAERAGPPWTLTTALAQGRALAQGLIHRIQGRRAGRRGWR